MFGARQKGSPLRRHPAASTDSSDQFLQFRSETDAGFVI